MIKVIIWEACGAHCCLWPVVSQHIDYNAQSGEAITSQHQQPRDTESDWSERSRDGAESEKYTRFVDGSEDGGDEGGDGDKEYRGKNNMWRDGLEGGRKRVKMQNWSFNKFRMFFFVYLLFCRIILADILSILVLLNSIFPAALIIFS